MFEVFGTPNEGIFRVSTAGHRFIKLDIKVDIKCSYLYVCKARKNVESTYISTNETIFIIFASRQILPDLSEKKFSHFRNEILRVDAALNEIVCGF